MLMTASLIPHKLLLRLRQTRWSAAELFQVTIAFKDMALSILPYMTTAAKKHGLENKIVILTATSGDTGKAAMARFADVPGTEIIGSFIKDGVKRRCRIAMTTQALGTAPCRVAIDGNFDVLPKPMSNTCSMMATLVKRVMAANKMRIHYILSSQLYEHWPFGALRLSITYTPMRSGQDRPNAAGESQFSLQFPSRKLSDILAELLM